MNESSRGLFVFLTCCRKCLRNRCGFSLSCDMMWSLFVCFSSVTCALKLVLSSLVPPVRARVSSQEIASRVALYHASQTFLHVSKSLSSLIPRTLSFTLYPSNPAGCAMISFLHPMSLASSTSFIEHLLLPSLLGLLPWWMQRFESDCMIYVHHPNKSGLHTVREEGGVE